MLSSSQNSLASRQGLSRAIMRPRSSAGANCSSMLTPASKPSKITPATISRNNKAIYAKGIQNPGSLMLNPCEAANISIMMLLPPYERAPRHSAQHKTTCL